MKFGEFSVKNSLAVNLLTVFFIVGGLVALTANTREAFPNIKLDVVSVITSYFGAPAEEIENLVTIPLEEEVFEVDDLDELRSVSAENISVLVIEVDPDVKNKDRVVNDIQRAVDRVNDLPEDAEDPEVEEIQNRNIPVLEIAVSGDLPEAELQQQVKNLEDRLRDIKGVAGLRRSGWHDREIWVELDPKKLMQYKVTTDEVVNAIRGKNINLPGGILKEPDQDYLVRTMGEFETPDEVNDVIIRANDVGNWVRVGNVGNAKWAFEEDDLIFKSFGTHSINLSVLKRERGDIITVVDEVQKDIVEFLKTANPNLKIQTFNDFSYYVKRRLNVLVNNGLVGLILVIGCLFLTMGRSTALMTALGIPLALAVAFLLMSLFGFTINLLTMFGLIMVLGMIVDDAIIVSENIYRHMEMGESPSEAAIKGTDEVWLPVTSAVLTTVAAFVPLFFMTGIMGKYVFFIPAVVIMALVASLVESLLVLPAHLAGFAEFLKKIGKFETHTTRESHWFPAFQERYRKLLKWIMHHRMRFVALSFLGPVLAVILFKSFMSYQQFPQGMIEEFFIRAEAPLGTPLDETANRMSQLEALVHTLPDSELDAFITQIGAMKDDPHDPYVDRGTHLGQIQVFLTPEQTRKRKAMQIIADLSAKAKSVEGFENIYFEERKAGPPTGKPIEVEFRGTSYEPISKMANQVKEFLKTRTAVFDVRDDYEFGKMEYRVIVNEKKAARSGITVDQVARTVRNAFEGGVATTIQKSDEEIDVLVRFPRENRSTRESFEKIEIQTPNGRLIPLKEIATFEIKPGIRVIKHFDRKRVIKVSARLDEEKTSVIEEVQEVKKFINSISDQYPNVTVRFGGEAEDIQEAFQNFFRAFPLALLLIYIILAIQFGSVIQPIPIMITIPFGLVGVIFAFFLHGNMPVSFMSIIGMIGLSGIVVNDAIVLISFINEERKRGVPKEEAIINGAVLRLRPVFLTTLTTVLGLGPVAYGIGGNDPFIKPMALAIAWGLVFSTVLTLLIIPCFYSLFDGVKERVSEIMNRLFRKLRAQ